MSTNSTNYLTLEQADKIAQRIEQGYLVKDIILFEGVTKSQIYRILRERGLKSHRGRLNKLQEMSLIEDYQSGLIIKEIELKYDISDEVIWNTLNRYNISRDRKRAYPDNIDELLMSDYSENKLVNKILEDRGVSRTKFYYTLHKYDIKPNRLPPLSEQDELAIIERYKGGDRPVDIADDYPEYNCHHFIYAVLKKYNVPIVNHLAVLVEDYLEIGERYINGESTGEIGIDYGCSPKAIIDVLEKLKIDRRDLSHAGQFYKINENYFEKIDTPEKAYWLGFIFGDGCLTPQNNSLQITLQDRDIGHLEKFKKAIGSTHPIKTFISKSGKGVGKPYCKITIVNKKMALDLLSHNVVHRKTYDLRWPNTLPKELDNHFVRGKFDSDGCLCITNPKKFYFCVTSFYAFLSELKSHIEEKVEINCLISEFYKEEKSSAGNLWVAGNRQILKVLEWLFQDHGGAYLDRKYEQYKQSLILYRDVNGSESMEEYLHAH